MIFVFLRFQYTDPLQLKVGSRSVYNYLDPQLWLTVSVFTNMHANKGCENFKRRFQSISSIFIKSDRLGTVRYNIRYEYILPKVLEFFYFSHYYKILRKEKSSFLTVCTIFDTFFENSY